MQHSGVQDVYMHENTLIDTKRTCMSEICWLSRSVLQYSSMVSCSREDRRVVIPLDAIDV